jgi:N utilization substance protein B
VLRPETKVRARALQLLYAWELQGRPPMDRVVFRLLVGGAAWRDAVEQAEPLATGVAEAASRVDEEIAEVVENWRPERVGLVERNILRLAVYELLATTVPPRVVISEAVQLAHWFAGARAPAFVNGVLDAIARRSGKL